MADGIPPSAPSELTAVAVGPNQINLSWSAATDNVAVVGYVMERCQGMDCTNFVEIPMLATNEPMGPLIVSAVNPRYFATPNGKTVMLGGSHHWINLVDSGLVYPPPTFDYDAWLDFLTTNHHNFFRLWAQGLPKKDYLIQDAGPWYQSPQAWLRTGPGNATDGLPKFDLTQFNQAYFDRIRERVEKARDRGIYVSVMLFDGYHLQFSRRLDDGYPLTGTNNINAVNDGGGTRSQNLSVIPAAVLAVEEAYVRKVIDTVNDLPNVLYEIANEAGSYSTTWQQHFITFIKNYEAGKAFQHPVGFTFQHNGGANSTLYNSQADWISPADDALPVNNGTHHVVLNDTDHSYYWVDLKDDGPQAWRNFIWRNITVGNSVLFMDPYLMPWVKSGNTRNAPGGCVTGPSCTMVDSYWDQIRQNIGYTLDYANGRLNLAKMTPKPELSSVGFCLANATATGAEYLVYASSGGTFSVNLSATTRPILVEWLNPSTGVITSGGLVTGGSTAKSFTAPFSGNAVLYLADPAAHVPDTNYNDMELVANTTYRYRVRAFDTEGDFGPYSYSSVATATTPGNPQITITTVELLDPDSVRITGMGGSNETYTVQKSSNLTTWEVLGTTTTDGFGAFEYIDTTAGAASQRFYRIVIP